MTSRHLLFDAGARVPREEALLSLRAQENDDGAEARRGTAAIVPTADDDRDEWQRSSGQRTGQMIIFNPNPHKLRVTPSAKEPGRFDWAITRDEVIVRQSVRSFGSEGASAANGDVALREMTARWQGAR